MRSTPWSLSTLSDMASNNNGQTRRESWIRLKAKAEQLRQEQERSRKRVDALLKEMRELSGRA